MEIIDLYTELLPKLRSGSTLANILSNDQRYKYFLERALDLKIDLEKIGSWMTTSGYSKKLGECIQFVKELPNLVHSIESKFGTKLLGTLTVGPSLRRIDGFARFDAGRHDILIGPDHPRCDSIYLKVLLAHELSHVYREQLPSSAARLGKSLGEISRQEYLDSFSLLEHLASEGLAVVFSKIVFPGAEERYYTFHSDSEINWCRLNEKEILKAIQACSMTESQDAWNLYNVNTIAPGSAPWSHYYWAAKQVERTLRDQSVARNQDFETLVLEAHAWPSENLISIL